MKFASIAAIAVSLAAAPATAVTYDAYDSFNGSAFAGPFVFFEFDALTGGTPLANHTNCAVGLDCLLSSGQPGLGFYKNSSGLPLTAFGTVDVPAHTLFFHPGQTADAGVLFLAPATGSYRFQVAFSLLSNTMITGVQLTGYRFSGGNLSALGGISLDAQFRSDGAGDTIALAAGQGLAIGINAAGDYQFDSTSISFQVSNVPEPKSWALMVAGFGLAGVVLRRRRVMSV